MHKSEFGEDIVQVLKPTCVFFQIEHEIILQKTQIYASKTRSYRDLPIKYMESEKQYRAELSGAVSGLSRVYAITVEDGHAFCRVDQIKQEVIDMVNIIRDFYSNLGLWDKMWVSLSVRDYAHPEKYIGESKDWDKAEKMLEEISKELKLNAKRCEGEAALYGPKLDFMFKDAFGKEIQIPTVQLDFATPQRFKLSYIDEKNKEVTPVMIHRAILGSYERFMMLMIENFAGKFPLWLSPVQVKIINVNDRNIKYCEKVKKELEKEGFRVETNFDHITVSNKIRLARENDKPNYMLILGDEDEKNKTISVRTRKFVNGKNEEYACKLDKFVKDMIKERDKREIKNQNN
jgi:threonyl-tRNA synthetase